MRARGCHAKVARRQGRPALALAAVLALAVAGTGCRATPRPPPLESRLDCLMDGLHAKGWFNGALVVARGTHVLYERGVGAANVTAGTPFTPDTASDGASLARPRLHLPQDYALNHGHCLRGGPKQ
ncbi:MAG TPA: hypothetical protein PKE47_16535 [Verrucomicrobiota bacterium]|nr:hypothetical protein [Verrucomicrobiota bacterium]